MPKRPVQASPAEQKALSTYIKLWRATHCAESAAHRHLTDHGLTLSQFAVLEAVYHVGPLNQRQLADKILRSSGNLTMVIDNLERGGLVERQRSVTDRRMVMIHLTTKGHDLIASVLPQHIRGIAEVFAVLTPAEMEELGRLTRKLGLSLQETARAQTAAAD